MLLYLLGVEILLSFSCTLKGNRSCIPANYSFLLSLGIFASTVVVRKEIGGGLGSDIMFYI